MPGAPPGYVTLRLDRADVVCADHITDATRIALHGRTLYEYAKEHAHARAFSGRGISYAVPLPGDVEQVVVRHNRHGGLLASFTGDLFRPPTRAPLELQTSERLHDIGVPTPRVLGYAIYAGPLGFVRVDVMTREVPSSTDLSAALLSDDASVRVRALRATATLVASLTRAGARHHDLNAKNILMHELADGTLVALVLDVDRVEFGPSNEGVLAATARRPCHRQRAGRASVGVTQRRVSFGDAFVNANGPIGHPFHRELVCAR
jgi:hypothetical protein